MSSPKPLAGQTVVEIGHSVAAPYAGYILSELGAEVIKVENPKGGDYARGWGPPFWEDISSVYHSLNRGKLGVTVDFSDPAQAANLRRLVLERADVVIQNLRGGAIDRYGLGAEELLRAKPSLIYCNIGAFGESGPLSDRPGYDPLMQAFAGIMSITGEGNRPPVRVGVSMVDMGAGMWVVIGILSAMLQRRESGKGGVVGTSLFETALAWMTIHMAGYQASGDIRKPYGSGLAEIVPYQAFMTRDGWLMVAAGNDGLFRRLCTALDRPDLADDPRFVLNKDRVVNRQSLVPVLEEIIARLPMIQLVDRLDAAGIPNAPMQTIDAVAAHPQTKATGIVQDGPAGALPLVGIPLTFDGMRSAYTRRAPKLGEHNDDVLRPVAAADD